MNSDATEELKRQVLIRTKECVEYYDREKRHVALLERAQLNLGDLHSCAAHEAGRLAGTTCAICALAREIKTALRAEK
jgi:C4-dicarboxylate-specific signal transduction histidine kinase